MAGGTTHGVMRWLGAIAGGLFLATLPYWRFVPLGGALAPHMDHEPRHGGQLGMVGDHHIEVVRRRGQVEVFVSDAVRREVRPQRGWVVFDRSATTPLAWEDHRLVGPDRGGAREIEARVILPDTSELAISFDFTGDTPQG